MIVFPHEAHLRIAIKAAASAGYSNLPPANADLHRLCEDRAVRELVFRDLMSVARKNALKNIEVVQGIVLGADEWTPESGLVTAAQKVQRKNVENAFKDQIKVSIGIVI
jgi:long-chain acyl-CoA synthetase